MSANDEAKRAILKRIETGEEFLSRDLAALAQAQGVDGWQASVLVNSFTQSLANKGHIVRLRHGPKGTEWVWQIAPGVPLPPPPAAPVEAPIHEAPPPLLASASAAGPYDPPAALEGPNNGLTEAVAEFLWHDLGGGDRERTLKENTSIMEARAWRGAAERLLSMLFGMGMVGPAGVPNKLPGAEWTYGWVYEAANWEIIDAEGAGVALVLNDADVPMMLAAPVMAGAIKAVMARFQEKGGVKFSDLQALQASLPKQKD